MIRKNKTNISEFPHLSFQINYSIKYEIDNTFIASRNGSLQILSSAAPVVELKSSALLFVCKIFEASVTNSCIGGGNH